LSSHLRLVRSKLLFKVLKFKTTLIFPTTQNDCGAVADEIEMMMPYHHS
jgi:hypothetical protein